MSILLDDRMSASCVIVRSVVGGVKSYTPPLNLGYTDMYALVGCIMSMRFGLPVSASVVRTLLSVDSELIVVANYIANTLGPLTGIDKEERDSLYIYCMSLCEHVLTVAGEIDVDE